MTFLVSTLFAIAGSLLLLIGASIWTVIIQRSANINDLPVHSHSGDQSVPLGIVVSLGPGLLLTWAAFACLVASVIPYMIRCVIDLLLMVVLNADGLQLLHVPLMTNDSMAGPGGR
jgi:uncharacterized BrkB/YihY/UPF0761 family membrane protein